MCGVGFLGAVLALGGMSSGCARPKGALFQRAEREIVWPAPPAPPRVRYVGSLRHAGDLSPGRSFWEGVNETLIGVKTPEPLYGPRSVVCTPDGQRLWVSDPGGRCLHLFDLENRTYRRVDQVEGSFLRAPVSVALGPAGSLYVCDAEAVAIYRFDDRDGSLIESLRLPSDVLRPVDVWYNEGVNELFVVDTTAHDVKVLARDGSLLRVIGTRGVEPGLFNFPTSIAGYRDRIWISDTGNNRVQALTLDGSPILTVGQAGDAPGDLALPKGVAVDADGRVYVVDARFENVQIFDPDGRLLLFFGEEGTDHGAFWLPADLFIEPGGRIWVCDTYNRRVQVFELVDRSDSGG